MTFRWKNALPTLCILLQFSKSFDGDGEDDGAE
jgi:hypothetical protein